jgi:predicted dehydrogenase
MIAPALAEREALGQMVEAFARSIRSGEPALTDGRAGLRVLEILEGASKSLANEGARIALRSHR